ncbi:hypothetical protein ACFYUJ_21500 [Streptomyces sp. NPDC004520]|uniref:hypothetical protein n=1 Tax=Streptomyces sp. NPDC004520 TaxID=3364702 RepID=UPI00369989CE
MNLPAPKRPEGPLLLVVDEAPALFAAARTGRDENLDRLMALVRDLPRIRTAVVASRAALAQHTDRSLAEESDR